MSAGSIEAATMNTTSFFEQVELSISDMQGADGRQSKRAWRKADDDEKLDLCDQLRDSMLFLYGCPDCVGSVLRQPGFDHKLTYSLNVETIRELLDLILEYLPMIIALFSARKREEARRRWQRFSVVILFVGFTFLFAGRADAQVVGALQNCPNGQCQVRQPVRSAVKAIAASPVRAVRAVSAPRMIFEVQPYSPPAAFQPSAIGVSVVSDVVSNEVIVSSRPMRFGERLFERVRAFRQRFGIIPRLRARRQ